MEATPDYVDRSADLSPGGGFSRDDDRRPKIQDVVPQVLLDQCLSMTDPS
jgi:serine/threonine-protein phosphatase 4 regulatory subunit 1